MTRTAPTLLAVAHGTRDAEGIATTEALVARVRALRPWLRVERCFLDIASPSLPDALATLRGEVVLVPLLLGAGYHVRVDIPEALAAAPWLRARVAGALGPDPLLADALAERLAEAGRRPGDGPVVLAAAGSTDPAANADAAAMAALLRSRLGSSRLLDSRPEGSPPSGSRPRDAVEVVPAYLCAAGPTPAEAVASLRAAGHARVAVAEYLLSPGHFARLAARTGAEAGACLTSAPLGPHDALARLVTLRYDQAVMGAGPDTAHATAHGTAAGRTGAHSGRMLTPGYWGAHGRPVSPLSVSET
ncbi:sirohydrochlorin chelatase [Streptacidiphilus rugosus]|uniref:sirohydrochlorin chelatase n=1 Tax=Streptacidiphilus rugosus TaxID=405783 RepID=UPI000691DF09|nr:CbiX/SirB N-terminal domain-containing protein [Streptacidiphilus rugosus]